MSGIYSLRRENQKRKIISLLLAEIELSHRIQEIRQNYPHQSDSDQITEPILSRLAKIRNERVDIESELEEFD